MAVIQEVIPEAFADEAEAARSWFAHQQSADFALTAIVDPQDVLSHHADTGARELELILCGQQAGQELCLRERFIVRSEGDGYEVTHLAEPPQDPTAATSIGSPAPMLDPPVGVRAGWLDSVLPQYAFVVLVFYRGFG